MRQPVNNAPQPRRQTRERAKHLLVHRANGGIHNAAIALKLVTASAPSTGTLAQDTASFVAAGVRGTANAARALQLLGALVGLESVSSPTDRSALVDDIATILRGEARRHRIDLRIDLAGLGPAVPAVSIERLAEMLIAGLSALEGADPNSAVTMQVRDGALSSDLPQALEIEVAPGRAPIADIALADAPADDSTGQRPASG
jgi:hypothetical protein